MSTRLELPPDLLNGRRPLGPRVDGETRSAILQLAQLTDRGECLEAAQQAVQLLRADVYDLRLAGVYLVGVFVERGVAYLPELLRCTRRLVADEAAAPAPWRVSPRVLDTTLQWLFQAVLTHIQFHAQRRDEAWTQWLAEAEPGLPTAVASEVEPLDRAIAGAVEQPVSTAVLGRIGRWAAGDLARALARVAKDATEQTTTEAAAAVPATRPVVNEPASREPERESDDDDIDDLDADLDADVDEDRDGRGFDEAEDDGFDSSLDDRERRSPPTRMRPGEAESAALATLRRKLRGFEVLVERGELPKAAIIARDVQVIIERFDPVEFLPSLFAGYFRTMNEHLDELLPHLHEPDGTPWSVLSRFYQSDLDGFIDE